MASSEQNYDAADCEDASKDIDELGDKIDATCPSKADLKDDESDEVDEDSEVSNGESTAPVVNGAAVQNGDAVEEDSDEKDEEEESKPAAVAGKPEAKDVG